MNKKDLGRNDICWCGSGRKYKHCHLNREHISPLTFQDKITFLRKTYNKEYCLHPMAPEDCQGKIVKAHAIQKARGLDQIAQNGHVYSFSGKDTELLKIGKISANLIGINKASTFTGFCGYHDDKIFEPLEKGHSFEATQEQIFLLGYRALCRELFFKKAAYEQIELIRQFDRGKNINHQVELQQSIDEYKASLVAALRELEHYKTIYDNWLIKSDYSSIKYYVLNLSEVPDFICSGVTQPLYDFDGQELQRLSAIEHLLEHLAFSIIPSETGGVIIFSWVDEDEVCLEFMKSFDVLPDNQKIHATVRFALEHFENIFATPVWWEALSPDLQNWIIGRQLSGMHPYYPALPQRLQDDGVRVVSWSPTSMQTNLYS